MTRVYTEDRYVDLDRLAPLMENGVPDGWRAQAACKGAPVELFFRDYSTGGDLNAPYRLCATCPVRYECLADNLYEPFGIWGGVTVNQRRRLRRRWPRPLARPMRHGVYWRYEKGCRCDPCCQAKTLHIQEQREAATF